MYAFLHKMAYSQIYLHCVFATKYRQAILDPIHDEELQKYITGIVQHPTRKCKMLAINNVEDHMHMFLVLHPVYSPAKLMQEVKAISSKFINESGRYDFKFQWQIWYGCFSYAKSQVSAVSRYIQNQKQHHKKIDFENEYLGLLKEFGVEYDKKYVFD